MYLSANRKHGLIGQHHNSYTAETSSVSIKEKRDNSQTSVSLWKLLQQSWKGNLKQDLTEVWDTHYNTTIVVFFCKNNNLNSQPHR